MCEFLWYFSREVGNMKLCFNLNCSKNFKHNYRNINALNFTHLTWMFWLRRSNRKTTGLSHIPQFGLSQPSFTHKSTSAVKHTSKETLYKTLHMKQCNVPLICDLNLVISFLNLDSVYTLCYTNFVQILVRNNRLFFSTFHIASLASFTMLFFLTYLRQQTCCDLSLSTSYSYDA